MKEDCATIAVRFLTRVIRAIERLKGVPGLGNAAMRESDRHAKRKIGKKCHGFRFLTQI